MRERGKLCFGSHDPELRRSFLNYGFFLFKIGQSNYDLGSVSKEKVEGEFFKFGSSGKMYFCYNVVLRIKFKLNRFNIADPAVDQICRKNNVVNCENIFEICFFIDKGIGEGDTAVQRSSGKSFFNRFFLFGFYGFCRLYCFCRVFC